MAYFSKNAEEFLDELEVYLDSESGGDDQQLEQIILQLKEFEDHDEPEYSAKAVQLLGTAVGKNREWQVPFRKRGILAYVTERLDPNSPSLELEKQYLRVIGNCVADNETDQNRELVVNVVQKLSLSLDQEVLRTTTFAVWLNLCNDYAEQAQAEAARLRVDAKVAALLSTGKIPEEALEYAIDLLNWATEKLTPPDFHDPVSLKTFEHVLHVALEYDEDTYYDLVSIIAHYLQQQEFQEKVATPDIFGRLVDLTLDYESRLEPEELDAVLAGLSTQKSPDDEPSDDTTVLVLIQLVNSLSAISSTDLFVRDFGIRSPVIEKVISKLQDTSASPSTVLASVIMGNVATSDQVSTALVEDAQLHTPVIALLFSSEVPAILYAAAAFVRHLAFPEVNRTVLGEAGLIKICCRLLVNKDPSVRGEAAAIIGKLCTNNLPNIQKVVLGAVPEGIAVAKLPEVDSPPPQPTILYHIVTQALAPAPPVPSTSMKNTLIEIGRTIVAILRYVGQSQGKSDEVIKVAEKVFQTPLVARPVARLVRQRFFAEARSEGLLGLGLMAQSKEGAAYVIEEMKADRGFLDAVKELATEGNKEASGLGRDHQNALVLLHGLINNGVSG
ncbi:armadillo-type protein [Dendryphion nanum]|uniref:Armadillo-type protein n=1 Tax=Dendryphion nanum TaxID=256645 RepID=A0A9P9EJU2_9PLEO|nr:armadillo-type protein [Dendryphion nanum]